MPGYADPAGGKFIVRLQRIGHSDRNVCALVRADGLFHVEKQTLSTIEVSEGSLDDAELLDLRTALNNEKLADLTQSKISTSLVQKERDEFWVAILHSSTTQNLRFVDRESRRPYDDVVDPLLRWLDTLQHHAHTRVGGAELHNNCQPPKKPSPRTETQVATESPMGEDRKTLSAENTSTSSVSDHTDSIPAKAVLPQKRKFLMHWDYTEISRGLAQNTCVILYPSGQYREELSTQRDAGKPKLLVVEDTLPGVEMQSLQSVLDEPELKSSTHLNLPVQGKAFREAEITILSITRDNQIQRLGFADYFGDRRTHSSINYAADTDELIVSPLRKWLKEHLDPKKAIPLQNPVQTRCQP
jgi:hypothetical protein